MNASSLFAKWKFRLRARRCLGVGATPASVAAKLGPPHRRYVDEMDGVR